jgi:hypothetical protein
MRTKLAILVRSLAVSSLWAGVSTASPEDDQVAAYLKSHDMLSLLEVQLEERIRESKNDEDRDILVEELSKLYLSQLRSFDKNDPYRQIVINRARSLTTRMSSIPMYELRIELLIEAYLGVEARVELSRLELLEPDQRSLAITELSSANHKLKLLSKMLDPEVARVDRLVNRSKNGNEVQLKESLPDLRRYRSLAHYYHAWTGYSLAVLKTQHVPSDVFQSFGWLLGAEGEMPQFSVLNETTLEFEHVARSAVGVALAYAQSEDASSGRAWAKFVSESEHTEIIAKAAAEDRLLQIMAADRDWTDAYRWMLTIEKKRGGDENMRVSEARFLALQSLRAMESSRVGRGGVSEANKVARYAIEQLVKQGEIGHVLDLYSRFGSLPVVADSFITNYAQALDELNRAEESGRDGMYASVATRFAQALESGDADRFPNERDDCRLKLAYTEIRSGRATEGINVCDQLIEQSIKEEVIEEARWIRIAAIDSINMNAGNSTSDDLEQAVREYIVAYPSSSRSAKLILRHAMQGTVDPEVAIGTLGSIQDDDPIAIPARRTLVQLRYQSLRAMRFSDPLALEETLMFIRWIDNNEPREAVDLNDAKARMGTIRIGVDIALRVVPGDLEFAQHLVERGMSLMSYDSSLGSFRSEFVYRQIEIAIGSGRVDDASELLNELESLDIAKADIARVLLLNDLISVWKLKHSANNARRVVDIGSVVLASQTAPYPEPIGIQVSTIAEVIAESAAYLWTSRNDSESRDLALLISLLVLERGNPSEQGLRRTALLANNLGDQENELESWLRLLAAYSATDDRWYEARFESLRVMNEVDPIRARKAYAQFKALHPSLGPQPWSTKISNLFGESPVQGSSGASP